MMFCCKVRTWSQRFALILVAALLVGCSGGSADGLTQVTGTVKLNGEPLKSGTITFMPVAGTTSATGEIEDGEYSLSTTTPGDGAPPGDYKVSVTAWEKLPTMTEAGVPAVPEKYMSTATSGLKAHVQGESSHEIDFDLKP